MPGLYGERWAVTQQTEPPSQPYYYKYKKDAKMHFDAAAEYAQPGWGARLHFWSDYEERWVVIESAP